MISTEASPRLELPLPARDVAFLILIASIWGCNAVLTKIALGIVPPLFLSVVRFSITLLVLLPFIKPLGTSWSEVDPIRRTGLRLS